MKKIAIGFCLLAIILYAILAYGRYRAVYNFGDVGWMPTELMVYDLKVNEVKTSIYRHPSGIETLHNRLTNKSGVLTKFEDFQTCIAFDYGYKGVTIRVDQEGRVLVPVRIIDLKETSAVNYVVWKTYQLWNKSYWAYYVSEPDEDFLRYIQSLEFEEIE